MSKLVSHRMVSAIVSLLLLATVAWILWEEPAEISEVESKSSGLSVTVIDTLPTASRVEVKASGITMARWATAMTASVSGRVTHVADHAIPGNIVAEGESLVSLLDTAYRSEWEASQARVAEAELSLAEVLNRQYVAKKVDKTKSSFGRFEPHVKAARANLKAAQAALASAQQQLAETQIKSPFDAIVISESVHEGMWVNAGEVLFHIAASDSIDIKVELSNANWQRLNGINKNESVIKVVAPSGQSWNASLRFLSPVMDPVTRQRSMVLQVANPYQHESPLLADQQVTIIFEGEPLSNVVTAPASVLTEDGQVWSVIDNALTLESIELLDEQPDHVMFRYKNQPAQKRHLVRFPLSTLLEGQSVSLLNF